MYDVTMPKLSDSMQEGRIIAWKVAQGQAVREGDVLAEIESDKAAMELECFHSGVIAEILQPDGAEVKVGEVIARIAPAGTATQSVPARSEKRPAAEKPAVPKSAAPRIAPMQEPAKLQPPARPRGGGVAISPYARKLAAEKGIDITTIHGTGPDGRIIARDIEQTAQPGIVRPAAKPAERVPITLPVGEELPPLEIAPGEADVEEMSYRQKTLARRVCAAARAIPHFYLTRSVDVTSLLARKDELKEKHGATLTHVLMRACVAALKLHPEVNRSYDRERIVRWKGVNVGLAIDTEDGLTVAVLRGAETLSLDEIAARTRALVDRAHGGKLTPEERTHATFTITNLGMFEVEDFHPIINPPSSITLAVSAAVERAVIRDGAIHIAQLMNLTAACDHRIIDGAAAARFMQDLRRLLEAPQ